MSMIDGIASFSTAMSQLRVQNEAAVRILKLAQGQGQTTANMVTESLEQLQASVEQMAEGLGDGFDAYA